MARSVYTVSSGGGPLLGKASDRSHVVGRGDGGVNLKEVEDAGEAVLYFYRSLIATVGKVLD